jgi:hypothetical protein
MGKVGLHLKIPIQAFQGDRAKITVVQTGESFPIRMRKIERNVMIEKRGFGKIVGIPGIIRIV